MKKLVLAKETIRILSMDSVDFIYGGLLEGTQGTGDYIPIADCKTLRRQFEQELPPTKTVPTSC